MESAEIKKQAEQLYARAPKLTEDEVREMNGLFPSYIFRRRRTREIWTTCCGTHAKLCPESEIMDAEHTPEPKPVLYCCHMGAMSAPAPIIAPKPMACPFCGKVSPVKELGRTGKRKNLLAFRRAAVLRQHNGALWAVCCDLTKSYQCESELTAGPVIKTLAVYRFVPGRVEYCRRPWETAVWTAYGDIDTSRLRTRYKVPEPFNCCSEYGMGYDVIGLGEVEKSPFRWCGVQNFLRKRSELMRYFTLCTAYPRHVEMLTKAGMVDAVVDFVCNGKRNADAFDWYDPDPRHGLGLSKTELAEFMAGSRDIQVLAKYKFLRRHKISASFQELYKLKSHLGDIWFNRVVSLMRKHKLSANRIINYLEKERVEAQGRKKHGQPMRVIAEWWCDYIDEAKTLGYDLGNDVFLLPKNLKKKHDESTKTAAKIREAKRSAEAKEKEVKRLRALAPRYTYSDGRWLIRPPVSAAEIVAEGKALRHCVGGYADRHISGATTILFLRDRTRPGRSLVTIEMRGAEIVQIHGWDDERTACKDNPKRKSPMEIYREFLDGWLSWLEAGSKRDKKGYPALPSKRERGVA